MKIFLTFGISIFFCFSAKSQVKSDDFSRIVLNTYIPQELKIPEESKKALENKLNQITSLNGIGGSSSNPRFIITVSVNIGTKDIIPGPPQMISQNIDVTLYTGDAIANNKFSTLNLSIKGVGSNENKAFIDAIKNINPKAKDISSFLDEGKTKIINYYTSQCDIILKEADALAEQYKYEEAIYTLMTIPETCKDCYTKTRDKASAIFKLKIESDCVEKVKQAKLVWSAEPDEWGATKAVDIMTKIIPSDGCKTEITKLSDEINLKLREDQRKKYEFQMTEMQKKYDTEQKRLDAERQIAVERIKNQPQTITYNHIYWW